MRQLRQVGLAKADGFGSSSLIAVPGSVVSELQCQI